MESGTQRVFAQRPDFRDLIQAQAVISRQESEAARIPVFQFRGIGKPDFCMGMLRAGFRPAVIENPSTHSQVHDPGCSGLQFKDQIFAAAENPPDRASLKCLRKTAGDRLAQRIPRKGNLRHTFTDKPLLKLSDQGFYFGHFGHCFKGAGLARLSHRISTAAADPGMSTALRPVEFLDVLSSTPAESSHRAPVSEAAYPCPSAPPRDETL